MGNNLFTYVLDTLKGLVGSKHRNIYTNMFPD